MQDARPISRHYLVDNADADERPSRPPILVSKLKVEHRATHHQYLHLLIEGQGGRETRQHEFVLSPYGATLLLNRIRNALEQYLGCDPTEDR